MPYAVAGTGSGDEPDTRLPAEVADDVPHHGELLARLDVGAGLAQQPGRDVRATRRPPRHAVLRGEAHRRWTLAMPRRVVRLARDSSGRGRRSQICGCPQHSRSSVSGLASPRVVDDEGGVTTAVIEVSAAPADLEALARNLAGYSFAHRFADPPEDDMATTTGRS